MEIKNFKIFESNFFNRKITIPIELERIKKRYNALDVIVVNINNNEINVKYSTNNEANYFKNFSEMYNLLKKNQQFEIQTNFSTYRKNKSLIAFPLDNINFIVLIFGPRSIFEKKPQIFLSQFNSLKILLNIQNTDEYIDCLNRKNLALASLDALLRDRRKEDPFQATLRVLLDLFNCSIGTIWEYHDNSELNETSFLTLEGAGEFSADKYEEHCLPEGKGLVWQILKNNTEQYIIKNNISIEEMANKNLYDVYKDKQILLIRLESFGELFGVACIASNKKIDTTILNKGFENFKNILALEIKNKKIVSKYKVLEKITQIIPFIRETFSEACQAIADELRQLMVVQAVSIFLKKDLNINRLLKNCSF